MIGDLFDSPWKILIVAVVLIVLFGSKKLPDATRSIGRSLRILKTEVQGLHTEDEVPEEAKAASPQQQQIDQLQLQLRELQQQQSATGHAATANGAPLTETQRTQQPG
ncbi:MAG: Sec-independent protein translocase subunit TatA [Streptosporangiaceae bacterium]|jgi:sec-independent protein translocase protein TatA